MPTSNLLSLLSPLHYARPELASSVSVAGYPESDEAKIQEILQKMTMEASPEILGSC